VDADSWKTLGGGGVIGALAVKLLWNWLSRERQEYSLYKNELAAHEQTKKELAAERLLRKDAEMSLDELRGHYDQQRVDFYRRMDEDRSSRESLKDEVFKLKTEVNRLTATLKANGIHHGPEST
jgi:hypothetical protein